MRSDKALLAAETERTREKLRERKVMARQDLSKPLPSETKRGPFMSSKKDKADTNHGTYRYFFQVQEGFLVPPSLVLLLH